MVHYCRTQPASILSNSYGKPLLGQFGSRYGHQNSLSVSISDLIEVPIAAASIETSHCASSNLKF